MAATATTLAIGTNGASAATATTNSSNNRQLGGTGSSTTSSSLSAQSLANGGDRYSSNLFTAFVRKMFHSYGVVCASQPWEVIVTTFMSLVSVLTLNSNRNLSNGPAQLEPEQDVEYQFFDLPTVTLAVVRCLSLLHIYYRFRKIHGLRSPFIWKIVLAYISCVYVLYIFVIWSIGSPDRRSLAESWFFIPLLIDIQKVTRMAQFALSSCHQRRICENVANGMYVLAPTFVLDILIKILLVSGGFLFGNLSLEIHAWYAVISLLSNLLVYLTFFPAGLSLVLELMYCADGRPRWDVQHILSSLPSEEGQSPVVHNFKVGFCATFLVIHIFCLPFESMLAKVCLALVLAALSMKVLFDNNMDEAQELRRTYVQVLNQAFLEDNEERMNNARTGSGMEEMDRVSSTVRPGVEDLDRVSNTTDEGISVDRSSKQRPPSPGAADDSSESSWAGCDISNLQDLQDASSLGQESTTGCSASNATTPTAAFPPSIPSIVEQSSTERKTKTETAGKAPRSFKECEQIRQMDGASFLTDEELVQLIEKKLLRLRDLENVLQDNARSVQVRRKYVELQTKCSLRNLPSADYNYDVVKGACCEQVIGYMTLPVGTAGPLNLDGQMYNVPMATTEGCLVASVNRGCSALRTCGVKSEVTADGMSRGPVVRFDSIARTAEVMKWLGEPDNFALIKRYFDSTTNYGKLQRLKLNNAGPLLFIRLVATTGDAMGMNMLSKGTEFVLQKLLCTFPDMEIVSLSGNFCTDKKPAAVNWLDGRGKSVTCEAVVPARIVQEVLKTTTNDLVRLNTAKNLVGSAVAGSIGGFNAQSANVVTAVFIACGQDAAQNVASSNCLTQMDRCGDDGRDLYITCTMPSIEVGTVGGGTVLAAQAACLDMLGVKGSNHGAPGENANRLARVVCATVLAGELSLMSALASGHLVKSHMKHNRSNLNLSKMASEQPREPQREQPLAKQLALKREGRNCLKNATEKKLD